MVRSFVLVDAHVHIYNCFELNSFLSAALANFALEANRGLPDRQFTSMLLLTESSGYNWFQGFRDSCDQREDRQGRGASWSFSRTKEDHSLLVDHSDGQRLFMIAGRQIVTTEKLEVLALCTPHMFEDYHSLEETVKRVRAVGGLPTIPWGAGKWLGHRGTLLSNFLERQAGRDVFLGDNSARPTFWGTPRHFRLAEEKGIKVLPGTDPLPFPSETARAGSFGFRVDGEVDLDHPAESLIALLKNPATHVRPYGAQETTTRFLRNQFAMQVRKRYGRRMVS